MNISFVGGGVMAEALVGGILQARLAAPGDIRVAEPVAERRAFLEKKYGLGARAANREVVDGAELVVRAVMVLQIFLVALV